MSKKQAQGLPLSISQNFLTSKRTIERLVRHACLTKHDTVLEIGAGKGHITRCLAQYSGSVIAYELDPAPAARFRRYSLHPMALPFPMLASLWRRLNADIAQAPGTAQDSGGLFVWMCGDYRFPAASARLSFSRVSRIQSV